MSTIAIGEISLGPDGRLRVTPDVPAEGEGYEFIWRAAMSVRWDRRSRTLSVVPVPGYGPVDEFKQIASAVKSEYGDALVIDHRTIFTQVPADLEGELRRAGPA